MLTRWPTTPDDHAVDVRAAVPTNVCPPDKDAGGGGAEEEEDGTALDDAPDDAIGTADGFSGGADGGRGSATAGAAAPTSAGIGGGGCCCCCCCHQNLEPMPMDFSSASRSSFDLEGPPVARKLAIRLASSDVCRCIAMPKRIQ